VRAGRQSQADDALACLHELVTATDELRRRLGFLFDGGPLTHLHGSRGMSYEQIVPLNRRLQVIELVSDAFKALSDAGSRFRQAEANALYGEGMTMDEIAVVLGVTRQRVSALLRQAPRSPRRVSPPVPSLSAPSAAPGREIHDQANTGKAR
jgi:Sigma-70, region 4